MSINLVFHIWLEKKSLIIKRVQQNIWLLAGGPNDTLPTIIHIKIGTMEQIRK